MKIKVIKIDAENRTIYPMVIENNLQGIYSAIGCDQYDRVRINNTEDVLIDDIGLLKGIEYGFQLKSKGYKPLLAGNAIIAAVDEEGNYTNCSSTIAQIAMVIDFCNIQY